MAPKSRNLLGLFFLILLPNDEFWKRDMPSQLAELPRSEFDPESFPHSAYVKFFCDIRDKSAIFNILRKNMTTFDIGNGFRGRKKKRE